MIAHEELIKTLRIYAIATDKPYLAKLIEGKITLIEYIDDCIEHSKRSINRLKINIKTEFMELEGHIKNKQTTLINVTKKSISDYQDMINKKRDRIKELYKLKEELGQKQNES